MGWCGGTYELTMDGAIISKTWSGGTDKALVVPPGHAYCRKTSLPADWKRCRIALAVGITNLTEDIGMPVAESIAAESEALTYHIGLIDSATGMPGFSGTKFVGMSHADGRPNVSMKYISDIPAWAFCFDGWWGLSGAATIGNGATMSRAGESPDPGGILGPTPNGLTGFFALLNVELDVSIAGSLAVYTKSGDVGVGPGVMGLNGGLSTTMTAVGTAGGGWWSDTVSVGCQYLFIRFPFMQNRVTIYGIKIMQLA